MQNLIAVTMAVALMVSPVEAQQHTHGQAADNAQGMMGMMQAQPGMMEAHCGLTPGGMMRSMMGSGTMRGGMMQRGMQQGGMMGLGMMQGGIMDMAGGPGMILNLEETLGLTQDQKQTLQGMRESTDAEVQEHLQLGLEAQEAATEMLQSGSPNLDAYEGRLHEAADHMVAARTVMARATLEARAELTDEQLEKLNVSRGMMMDLCRGPQGHGMMMSSGGQAGSGHGG